MGDDILSMGDDPLSIYLNPMSAIWALAPIIVIIVPVLLGVVRGDPTRRAATLSIMSLAASASTWVVFRLYVDEYQFERNPIHPVTLFSQVVGHLSWLRIDSFHNSRIRSIIAIVATIMASLAIRHRPRWYGAWALFLAVRALFDSLIVI